MWIVSAARRQIFYSGTMYFCLNQPFALQNVFFLGIIIPLAVNAAADFRRRIVYPALTHLSALIFIFSAAYNFYRGVLSPQTAAVSAAVALCCELILFCGWKAGLIGKGDLRIFAVTLPLVGLRGAERILFHLAGAGLFTVAVGLLCKNANTREIPMAPGIVVSLAAVSLL